ncbi:hypothetical protein ACP3VQ_24890 [Metapseudomonas otitidis]|uniref:hypothetical protein n=1 Tax=Metapseudomonas otitidis TaxID=319939 RepID=UPI003CEBFA77
MQVHDEDIRVSRTSYIRPIGRWELLVIITLGVMLGGLLKDGIEFLITRAMAEHYTQQFLREMYDQAEQSQRESSSLSRHFQEQQAEAERTRQENQVQVKRESRLTSPECQFWWQQHAQNPTEKTAAKKAHYCISN